MNVAITGASGLVGSVLKEELQKQNHQVFSLIRHQKDMSDIDIFWNIGSGEIELEKLENLDAVVHLAGESVANGRWTKEKKLSILDSRVKGTRLLCQSLTQLASPPEVLISASAIGYYGHCENDIITESNRSGAGFLARVCEQWEQETHIASESGIRVVHLRIGIVLSPAGGALKQMLVPFKMGLGGPLGTGQQYMSWIDLDDLVRTIIFCIQEKSIRDAVNGTAPHPVKNVEFSRTLGSTLQRPTIFKAPEFALQLALGNQMANEVLLSSTRAVPEKLLKAGFGFDFPYLKDSLEHLLK